MVYQSDMREADIAAVDTATQLTELGPDTLNNFDVPADVSRITEVIIGCAVDWTADSLLGYSTAVVLSGPGLAISGEYSFPGLVGATGGAAATSAGMVWTKPARYQTNIPVSAGSTIIANGAMLGEDVGSMTITCQLVYDGKPGPIKDYDYREESLTAANTPVSLRAKAGVASGDFDVADAAASRIVQLAFGGGVKVVAGPLRAATLFELSGGGLATSGYYRFQGLCGGVQDDATISGTNWASDLMRLNARIRTKGKGRINCAASMLEDDVGTIFAVCGIGYG